jgi:signal transduction histidine kinase
MRQKRSRSVRYLRGSVLVIAVALVAVSGFTVANFLEARRVAFLAATNGLPSVKLLIEARRDVRRLDGAMDAALHDKMKGKPFQPEAVEEARRGLGEHLDAYERLPFYGGELAKYHVVENALVRLDAARKELVTTLATGNPTAAQRWETKDWRRTSDELDGALGALINFDEQRVNEHIFELARVAESAIVVVLLFAFLSVLAAFVVTRFATRVVRDHERVLEERAEEWQMFSARVAHDLMNPLQSVSLALGVAKEHCRDETAARASDRGVAALRRVRATVEALLAFARSAGRPECAEQASAPAVVSQLVEELRPTAEDHFIELMSDNVPPADVACSANVLHILLSNLVQNAIKYMADRPVRRVTLKVFAGGGRDVTFEVHDTGPGLERGMEQRVFMPLVRGRTTDVGGIGLGLATVQRMVEAHRGSVGVHSTKGEGSVFWFRLPKARTQVQPHEESARPSTPA